MKKEIVLKLCLEMVDNKMLKWTTKCSSGQQNIKKRTKWTTK